MSEDYSLIVSIPHIVLVDTELTSTDKLVLIEILAHLTAGHPYCEATNGQIAAVFNLTETYVSKAISKLAKRKYIEIEAHEADGNKRVIKPLGVFRRLITYCSNKQDPSNPNKQDLKGKVGSKKSLLSLSPIPPISINPINTNVLITEQETLGEDKAIKQDNMDKQKIWIITAEVLTYYKQRWNTMYGVEQVVNKTSLYALKPLVVKLGKEKVMAALDAYFEDRSSFIVHTAHDLGMFIKAINRYTAKASIKKIEKPEWQIRQELADAADAEKNT